MKQFELRIAKRPGLLSEIASARWEKGCKSKFFPLSYVKDEEFHLAVDKAAVAKPTFIENGWTVTEEGQLAPPSQCRKARPEEI